MWRAHLVAFKMLTFSLLIPIVTLTRFRKGANGCNCDEPKGTATRVHGIVHRSLIVFSNHWLRLTSYNDAPMCSKEEPRHDVESLVGKPSAGPHIQLRIAHNYYRFERLPGGHTATIPKGEARRVCMFV